MLSSRLPLNLTANALSQRLAALHASGVAIIDLTQSNPTRAGISYPAGLLDALADARALSYEPHPLGMWSARAAVAGDFARRGLRVDPSHIALTASSSDAYGLLFKLLCDVGDEVLVPTPSYPLFEHLARLESVRAVPYPLERHGAWRIDMAALTASCTDRTRAVLVVSPNNPTGSWLHRDDLAELAALCAERRLALIGDEVFADYPLDHAAGRVSVLEQAQALTFALGGLSKSIALPQVKLGWIAVSGPAPEVEAALAAYEIIADTYLSVATPVQVAAPALLARGAAVREAIGARTRHNLDALRSVAAGFPEVSVPPVDAGWSAVMQVPAIRHEADLVMELLDRDRILVHPGYFFDFPHEAFLIVSLLVEPAVFTEAIGRTLSRATQVAVAR